MIVFDGLGKCRGEVHDHVTLPKCEIHIGKALQRGLKLLDPLLHGNVERGEGARRHGSGSREAVAYLETLYGLGDNFVIRSGLFVGGKIAADQQAPAQQIVIRSLHAGYEFGLGGNRRPSAAHRKIRIAQRRFPDSLRSPFVECRLVRQRQSRH
jgi:hypothetical protein